MILLMGDAYCNGINRLKLYGDSQLIIRYMTCSYQVRSLKLLNYVDIAKILADKFSSIDFNHISRTYNTRADLLAKKGAQGNVKK